MMIDRTDLYERHMKIAAAEAPHASRIAAIMMIDR
jgi:hypothetical protein